jgi:hypothetical protein
LKDRKRLKSVKKLTKIEGLCEVIRDWTVLVVQPIPNRNGVRGRGEERQRRGERWLAAYF